MRGTDRIPSSTIISCWIESFKHTISIKPDYAEAHFNLCLAYSILGDKISAFHEYNVLKELDQDKPNLP